MKFASVEVFSGSQEPDIEPSDTLVIWFAKDDVWLSHEVNPNRWVRWIKGLSIRECLQGKLDG